MQWLAKFVMDWLWGKLLKDIFPAIVDYIKKLVRKKQIDIEEEKENLTIKEIKKQIEDYQVKHGTKVIPPHLKQKLRDAARRRARNI